MCKECDTIQTTVSNIPRNNQQRLRKLLKNPQHCVKVWEPEKVCNICNVLKLKTEFWIRQGRETTEGKRRSSYASSLCKVCESVRGQERYATDFGARAVALVGGSRRRSEKKGLEFNLTKEFIQQKLEVGVCEMSGIPLQMNGVKLKHKSGANRPFSPSLDRMDCTKGYTMDNVKVVCWIYNAAKGVGTHEDVIAFVEAFKNV